MWDVWPTGKEHCMWYDTTVGDLNMWDVRPTGKEHCMCHDVTVGIMNMWDVWTTGNVKFIWCARCMKYELEISYASKLPKTGNVTGM